MKVWGKIITLWGSSVIKIAPSVGDVLFYSNRKSHLTYNQPPKHNFDFRDLKSRNFTMWGWRVKVAALKATLQSPIALRSTPVYTLLLDCVQLIIFENMLSDWNILVKEKLFIFRCTRKKSTIFQ